MSKIPSVYSLEQRVAICRLIYEDRRTAPEAVALAAEGVYGLEPFAMPATSAREIARRVKARAESQRLAKLTRGSEYERLVAAGHLLVAMHQEHVKRFHAAVMLDEEPFDHDGFRWIVRCHKELEGLAARRRSPLTPTGPAPNDDMFFDELQRIAEEEDAARREVEGLAE